MTESLAERLERARRERLAAEAAAAKPDFSEYADLVPEQEYERTDEDKKLDTVINSIDIVTAYRKWINKSPVRANERRKEGIKVSCPVPGHRDANPSAWLNTDKGLWFCAACDQGGDAYDLAAFYHGMTDYKSGQNFHDLRRAMAMDFGYSFVSIPGSPVPVMVTPEDGPSSEPVAAPPALSVVPSEPTEEQGNSEPVAVTQPADIYDLYPPEIGALEPELPWREFIPSGTFLHKYMSLTSRDDVAEEFHFWNAMTVLGFALGRNTTAYDRVPVYGNLFICTIGDTGSGKSQAKHHMSSLLDMAFRWEPLDPIPTGVKIIRGSASAEALIKSFDHQIMDPSRPKTSLGSVPVKGLIDYAELSTLTGKSDRQGNVLKPVMLEFYDCSPMIGTTSLASGILLARDAFASAHTTTQPQSLSKLVNQGDSDSGFLNRWFFASGKPKTRVAIGGEIIDIGPAVLPIQAIKTYYDSGSMLPWSPEAHEKFTEFYYDVIEPTKRNDGSGLLARLDLFYKKLSLLFSANIMADRIEEAAVDQMIAVHPYTMECYSLPAKKLRETTFTQVEDDVIRMIQRYDATGKALTAGNMVKELKRKGHRLDMVSRVIDTMVKTGLIQAEQHNAGKRGRPSVRYTLAK